MKKLIITIIAAILAVSLCACGSAQKTAESSSSDANSQSEQSNVSSQSEQTDASSQTGESQGNSKRDELLSFQVEINGTKLTVPFDYSQIAALGYTVDKDENLKPNTYTIGTFVKNAEGDSLHVQFWNGSKETKKYSECQISQIEFRFDNKANVVLPGNVKFDEQVTPEMVIAAYGEADYDNNTDDYRSISYENGAYESVKFMLYKDDKLKHGSTLTINHIER